jgi:hypothetical protein
VGKRDGEKVRRSEGGKKIARGRLGLLAPCILIPYTF